MAETRRMTCAGGSSDPPRTIVLELTYRCNLRCRMCWWWGDSGVLRQRENVEDELSLEELRRFVHSVSPFRPHIRITGGEPFIRQDLFALIEYIRNESMSCSLITNGTLCDLESTTRLVEGGTVSHITFSLNGDRQVDARVRGSGAFDKTIAAIKHLTAVKRTLSAPKPRSMINCVISRYNVEGLADLIRIGRQLGVPVRLQHITWYDERTVREHMSRLKDLFDLNDDTLRGFVNDAHDFDYKMLLNVLRTEDYLGHQGPVDPLLTLPALTGRQVEKWYTDLGYCSAYGCDYVSNVGRVKANGEVIPCPQVDYSLGNIRETGFVEIFQSVPARTFRQVVSESLLPGCVRCCKLRWSSQGIDYQQAFGHQDG